MKRLYAIIMSSKFLNNGIVGKLKDYIYKKFISDKLESKTNKYRKIILDDFMSIYEKEDWILGFGSFLKYYRDKTMDGQDIDIVIRYEDFAKRKDELQKRGYRLHAKFIDYNNNEVEYKLNYKGVEVDIIFAMFKDGKYYYVDSYVDNKNKDKVIREVVGNERITFGEGYCSRWKEIPSLSTEIYKLDEYIFKSYKDAEENLKSLYGNWKKRDDNFDPMNEELSKTYIYHNNSRAIYYINPVDVY